MILKHISATLFRRNIKCAAPQLRFLSEQTYNEHHYDIAVVGGGLVGSTLACTLGKNPKLGDRRILLLEGAPEKRYEITEQYSNRVVALNPTTCQLLKQIKAWDYIAETRFKSVKHMQVWDALSDALITFDNEESADGVIANIVEVDLILGGVYNELKNVNNVEVKYESKVEGFETKSFPRTTNIFMKNGTKYSCDLLVGCDGFNSQVRRTKNVHYISKNYNHSAVVATLNLQQDNPENNTAWQRFLPDSEVIGILPLTPTLSSLVWSMPQEKSKCIMSKTDEEFIQELEEQIHKTFKISPVVERITQSFDNLIKSLNCPSSSSKQIAPKIIGCEKQSRAAFLLGIGHATNYIGEGFVLVGDAAHRVHPLAGQGVNLGFGDVVTLNKVLGDAADTGAELADMSYLKKYEQERQRHNLSIMMAIHGLWNLYNAENIPVVLARSLGLQATHALTPLKKLLVSQASG